MLFSWGAEDSASATRRLCALPCPVCFPTRRRGNACIARRIARRIVHTARRVKFYSCGPTVYDCAHIGNFRAFLTYDILKRWLLYQG